MPQTPAVKKTADAAGPPSYDPSNPMIVQSDRSILMEVDNPKYAAARDALAHPYFAEKPRPKAERLFPTFPSKANQERRPRREPNAPVRGEAVGFGEGDFAGLFAGRETEAKGAGFRLRMG